MDSSTVALLIVAGFGYSQYRRMQLEQDNIQAQLVAALGRERQRKGPSRIDPELAKANEWRIRQKLPIMSRRPAYHPKGN